MNRVRKLTSLLVALIMVMSITIMPTGVSAAQTAAYIGDTSQDWHDSLAAELGVTFTDYSASTMEEAQIHASAFAQNTLYNYVVIDASLVGDDAASYEYLENILLSMLKVNQSDVPAVCVVADNSDSSAALKSVCENFGVDLIGLQDIGEEDAGSYIAANFNKAAMKAPVPENKQSAYSHAIYPVNHISEPVTITDGATETFIVYGSYVIVQTDATQSGTFSANVGGPIHTESLKSNLASGSTYSFYRLGQGQHELQITAEGTVAVTAIYSDAKPLYESLVMLGFEDNDLSASTTNRTGGTSKVDLKVVNDSEKGNVLNVKGKLANNNGALVIPAMLRHGQKYRISGQFKVLSMQNDGDYLNLYINQKIYADDSAEEKILSGGQGQGHRSMLKPVIGEWVDFSVEYTPTHTVTSGGNTVEASDYTEISFMLGSGTDTCEYRIDNIVIEPVVEDTALKIGYPGSKYENGLIQDFNDGTKVADWGNRSATNNVQTDGTLKIATDNIGNYNPEIARINNIYLTPGRYYKLSYSVWTTDDEEYTFKIVPYHTGATRQLRSDGTAALATVTKTDGYTDKVTKTKTTYEHIFNLGRTAASDDAGITTFMLSLLDSTGAEFEKTAEAWGNRTIYMDDFKLEPLDIAYNGDFENGAKYYGAHGGLATSVVEEDGNNVLKVDTPAGFPVSFYPDLFKGRAYKLSMDVKGDADAVAAGGNITATFETGSSLGNYSYNALSKVMVTEEWQTLTNTFVFKDSNTTPYPYQAFPQLKIKPSSTGKAGDIFIDNVKIEEVSLTGYHLQEKNIYGGNFRERVLVANDDKTFKDGFLYKVYSKDESGNEDIYTFGESKEWRFVFNLNSPDERIDIFMDSAFVWGSDKVTYGYGDISEWETMKLGTVKRSNAKITAEFTAKDFSTNAILKGKADVDNNDVSKKMVVLMAVYDADNKLIDVKMSGVTEVGKQGKASVTIESAALSNTANSAKLFVVESGALMPYVNLTEGVTYITKTAQ